MGTISQPLTAPRGTIDLRAALNTRVAPGEGRPPGPRIPGPLLTACFLFGEPWFFPRWRKRYGDVFVLRMWPFGFVIVADPAEVKRLFAADPDTLRAGEGNTILGPLVGAESVLLLDGQAHLRRRKLMLPPFHGERMRVYGDIMREIADDEIDRWPVGRTFPIHAAMQAITLRIIMRAVFGIEDAERRTALEWRLGRLVAAAGSSLAFPPAQIDLGRFSPWGRFLRLRAETDRLLFDEIARRRTDPSAADRPDVLSLLLLARDEGGRPLGDLELRDQLMTLLLAGHETTASSLGWAFERILRHPAVRERLCRELAQGSEGYLQAAIDETLRVRPVLSVVLRHATAPLEVGGFAVPAGTLVVTSIRLIHGRSDLYPEPERFRPERFEENAPQTYGWLPFGGGTRRCLGAAFANFEMKVVLRRVLERCALEPVGGAERERRKAITFVPARGARVVLRERHAPP